MKANKFLWLFPIILGMLVVIPVLAYDDDDVLLHLDMSHIVEVYGDGHYVVGAEGEQIEIDGPLRYESGLLIETGTTNYLLNPSAETNTTSWWAVAGSVTISRTEVHRVGDYALSVMTNGAVSGQGVAHNSVDVTPNNTYNFSAWIKGENGDDLYLLATERNAADGYVSQSIVNFTATGEWQRISTSMAFGSTGAKARIWIRTQDALATTFYVDGAQIEQQPNATTYCDGSLGDDYAWASTPHASASDRLTNTLDISGQITDITANTTWSARLRYIPSYAATDDWPDDAILWDTRGASDSARVYVEYEDSDDKYHVYVNGADRLQSSAQTFSAGDDQDIIVTNDFNNDVFKLYVNGALADTETVILGAPTLTAWMLGSDYAGANHANATIQEYTVFDIALTDSDVFDLYGSSMTLARSYSTVVNLPDDLISYWQMEEHSGTRADSWGDNDLTDNNTVLYATGIISNAAQFTAANSEYLSHVNNDSLDTGDIDFTASAWVYLDTMNDAGVMLREGEYALWYDNTLNRFAMTVIDPSYAQFTLYDSTPVVTGTWYFLAGWHNATDDELGIRVNGTETIIPYTDGVCEFPSTGNVFQIGKTSSNTIDGRIDEAAFWKRVLTPLELSYLSNSIYAPMGRTGAADTEITYLPLIHRNMTTPPPTPTPFPYPTSTPESPFIGIDYSGDTSWSDWAATLEAFFAPLFINVDSAEEGLNTLRNDVCGQGFDGDAGFLPGNSYDDHIETKMSDDPTILEVSYSFGMALGRPFAWIRALYSWLPAIQNSYNVAGINFFVMLINATTAGIVWIAFVIIVTYSLYFIRAVIDLAIQIYELIPFKAT